MKSKHLALLSASIGTLGIVCATAFFTSNTSNFLSSAAIVDDRHLSLSGANVASELSSTFSPYNYSLPVSLSAGGTRNVTISFSSVKNVDGNLVMEAGSTLIKTENSNSISALTAGFSGALTADFGFYEIGDYASSSYALESSVVINPVGNLFMLTATSETILNSLDVYYGCSSKAVLPNSIELVEGYHNDGYGAPEITDRCATVTYSGLKGNGYSNMGFAIPSSVQDAETNTMYLYLHNTGASEMQLRVNVAASKEHITGPADNQKTNAINISATFNGSDLNTDLTYGGSNVTLASGEKGILKVRYNTIYGKPATIVLFADSARGDDGTYSGSFVVANPVFVQESLDVQTLSASVGEGSPFTVTNHEGITIVTYESVTKQTYKGVYCWFGDQLSHKTSLSFKVSNFSDHAIEFEFSVGSRVTNGTVCDWYESSNHHAKFTVASDASRNINLVLSDDVVGADEQLEILANTNWEWDEDIAHTTYTNGHFEITNVSY